AILAGAAAEGDDSGIAVTYCPLSEPGNARRIVDVGVDGLLLAGYIPPDVLQRIARLGYPLVMVAHEPPGLACDRVLFDDQAGGRLVADLVLRHGHRRLAVVHGPLERSSIHNRVRGFTAAAGAHAGTRVETRPVPPQGQNAEGGYAAARALLAETHAEPPTAI